MSDSGSKQKFDRVSESLRAVLKFAHAEAQRLNDGLIGTEHLLLGLLVDSSQPAGALLKLLHVDFMPVREDIEYFPDRVAHPLDAERKLTGHAMQALERAIDVVNQFRLREVTPLHLLIGIVGIPTCTAAKLLQRRKVDPSDLHARLLRLYAPKAGELPAGPTLDWLDRWNDHAVRAEFSPSEAEVQQAILSWHALLVLNGASQFASLARARIPGTGHLLLALLDDVETQPGSILRDAGLNLSRLELVVQVAWGKARTDQRKPSAEMTPRLIEALHRAELAARAQRSPASDLEHLRFAGRPMKRGSVDAEHLLLGILGLESGVSRAVLDGYGINSAGLHDRILAAMRRQRTGFDRLSSPPESLWEWLNQQLIRRQWSLADLARESGIERRRLRAWARGKRRPSVDSCDALAAACTTDPNLVRRLAGRPPKPAPVAPMPFEGESPGDQLTAIEAMRVLFDQVRWDEGRIARMTELLRTMVRNDRETEQERRESP